MRYLTITVEKNQYGEQHVTVEQVLRKQCGFTKRQIRQAKFRPDGILKNGCRCRVTEQTVPGDQIQVCLEEEREVSSQLEGNSSPLEILYEDEDILAVNKPAGLVTHPQGGHYQDTLANQAAAYFQMKGETHGVRPVGRLDKETSGVVVFAKSQMAAARLQEQREKGIYQKIYLAAAQGEMEQDGEVHHIQFPIGPDPADRLKMCVCENGKPASTYYKVVKSSLDHPGISVLEVRLETGRTHQIRVHMASLGHPLVGDRLYGEVKANQLKEWDERNLLGSESKIQISDSAQEKEKTSNRAALHAWKVELYQPFNGKKIELIAPVPEDMEHFCSAPYVLAGDPFRFVFSPNNAPETLQRYCNIASCVYNKNVR